MKRFFQIFKVAKKGIDSKIYIKPVKRKGIGAVCTYLYSFATHAERVELFAGYFNVSV